MVSAVGIGVGPGDRAAAADAVGQGAVVTEPLIRQRVVQGGERVAAALGMRGRGGQADDARQGEA